MKTMHGITFQNPIPTDTVVFPDLPDRSEVHVWKIDTGKNNRISPGSLSDILSDDECAQMRRYRNPLDAARYATRHYWLRRILGGYCQRKPESVLIERNFEGQPKFSGFSVREPSGENSPLHKKSDNIEISISHSSDLALISVTAGFPTGIDLEYVDSSLDPTKLSDFCLSAREQELFSKLEYADRLSWFLKVWTAKEAALKYLGIGLTGDLRTYECRHGNELTLEVWAGHNDNYAEICRIVPIPAGKFFVTALAVPPQSFRSYRIFSVNCF